MKFFSTMQLSLAYQSILSSLQYINRGDAREFSLVWVSPYKCRVVHDDEHIHSINVDHRGQLDLAVAEYLRGFAEISARYRFRQYFSGKPI